MRPSYSHRFCRSSSSSSMFMSAASRGSPGLQLRLLLDCNLKRHWSLARAQEKHQPLGGNTVFLWGRDTQMPHLLSFTPFSFTFSFLVSPRIITELTITSSSSASGGCKEITEPSGSMISWAYYHLEEKRSGWHKSINVWEKYSLQRKGLY